MIDFKYLQSGLTTMERVHWANTMAGHLVVTGKEYFGKARGWPGAEEKLTLTFLRCKTNLG